MHDLTSSEPKPQVRGSLNGLKVTDKELLCLCMNIDTNKASTGPAKKEKINFTSYVEKEDVPCRIHLTKGYHFRPRQSREFRSALHPSLPLELSVPQLNFRKHPAIILRHLVRQQLKKKKVPEKQRHLMTLRGEQASKLRLFSNSQEECFGLHSWAPVKMLETSLLIVNAFCCCEIEMIVFKVCHLCESEIFASGRHGSVHLLAKSFVALVLGKVELCIIKISMLEADVWVLKNSRLKHV